MLRPLLPKLLSGALDLAFVRPPDGAETRLEFRPLLMETAIVALPQRHPLARRNPYRFLQSPISPRSFQIVAPGRIGMI